MKQMKIAATHWLSLLGLTLGLGLAGPAVTQPPVDPESVTVEALVIPAATPGPPWWKAEKDGKTVYLFSLPTTLPQNQKWDQSVLRRRIGRADAIVMPPRYTEQLYAERARQSLEQILPPELYARYVAVRRQLRIPASQQGQMTPFAAATQLADYFRDNAILDMDGGLLEYRSAADGRGTRRQINMPAFDPGPTQLEAQAGIACLEAAIEAAEAGGAVYRAAAEGWAKGDTRTALTGPRGDRTCRCVAPKMDVIIAYVNAIETAVKNPAVTIVVAPIPIHAIVAESGVVQRLRALGYTVTDPAGMDSD